jgi:hypothetical protein
MSYKKPKNPSKRATWFYQDRILVDNEALLWIATGPYKKDLCGKTIDGVIMYYNHLKEQYEASKKVNKRLNINPEEIDIEHVKKFAEDLKNKPLNE